MTLMERVEKILSKKTQEIETKMVKRARALSDLKQYENKYDLYVKRLADLETKKNEKESEYESLSVADDITALKNSEEYRTLAALAPDRLPIL